MRMTYAVCFVYIVFPKQKLSFRVKREISFLPLDTLTKPEISRNSGAK